MRVSRSGETLCAAQHVSPVAGEMQVEIWLVGGMLTLFVDGAPLLTAIDPAPLPGGAFALVADGFTRAGFDGVMLSAVERAIRVTEMSGGSNPIFPESTPDEAAASTTTYTIDFENPNIPTFLTGCQRGAGESGFGGECRPRVNSMEVASTIRYLPACKLHSSWVRYRVDIQSHQVVRIDAHADGSRITRTEIYGTESNKIGKWTDLNTYPSIVGLTQSPRNSMEIRVFFSTFNDDRTATATVTPTGTVVIPGSVRFDNIVYRCWNNPTSTPTATCLPPQGDTGSSAPVCQLATSTPTPTWFDIFTNTPTPTPTALASPTVSAPTATYQAALALATLFPLPMQPTNITTQQARLSDDEFANRANLTPALCSRDVNPIGEANVGYNLISPAAGEVMIIDETFGTPLPPNPPPYTYEQRRGNNAGLGIFLAYRVRVGTLPEQITAALLTYTQLNELDMDGWLYIAYAHINNVDAALAAQFANAGISGVPVMAGQVLATSGSTDTVAPHLDVTVFYVPSFGVNGGPRPSNAGFAGESQGTLPSYFNTFYRLFILRDIFGETKVVDPLIIWPLLASPIDLSTTRFDERYTNLIAQGC